MTPLLSVHRHTLTRQKTKNNEFLSRIVLKLSQHVQKLSQPPSTGAGLRPFASLSIRSMGGARRTARRQPPSAVPFARGAPADRLHALGAPPARRAVQGDRLRLPPHAVGVQPRLQCGGVGSIQPSYIHRPSHSRPRLLASSWRLFARCRQSPRRPSERSGRGSNAKTYPVSSTRASAGVSIVGAPRPLIAGWFLLPRPLRSLGGSGSSVGPTPPDAGTRSGL